MAYKTSKDWTTDYGWEITSNALSAVVSGATAGASIGGGIGAVIGGAIGFGVELIQGITVGNKKKVNAYIDQAKGLRKDATINRNKFIVTAKDSINKTKSEFDTTYGKGMFDQYDAIFMNILGLSPSNSLNTLLSNMQMDKVSGEITSRLNGKVDSKLLSSALSISDINSEYLEYLKEQMRAQETEFGLEMQSLANQDKYAYEQYYRDMGNLRLQYAQQFEQDFLQARTSELQTASSLGDASLEQATSGIRQTGSGTTQTMMVQFQNDLSNVARASATKFQLKMMGYEFESNTQSLMLNSYNIRNTINKSSLSMIGGLINKYNQQNSANKDYYLGILDSELAIDELNKGIYEADNGRTGFFNKGNSKDHYYKQNMESYFG